MRWQRRARQKEGRMRKMGIAPVVVSDISPVLDAKKLQGMTYHELTRYRHSLSEFVDRSNRIQVLPNGGAVSANEMKQLTRDIRTLNQRRARTRAKLSAMEVPTVHTQDYTNRLSSKLQYDVYGNLIPQERGETGPWDYYVEPKYKSRGAFLATRRSVSSWLGDKGSYSNVAAAEREKLARAFEVMNVEGVPELIRSLTDDQVEFFVERYGAYDDLNIWYISDEEYLKGVVDFRENDPTGYNEYVGSVLGKLNEIRKYL